LTVGTPAKLFGINQTDARRLKIGLVPIRAASAAMSQAELPPPLTHWS
jgi:hypothetical protein